ncbi:unnamed protein product [Fraxinus pennsylvanica]|uniref:Uncharacterized protein n=1 Tax=Fraxinus pennsylvanica TaxID=56036 RepID=A0AAD2A5J2_9LAMI|nr:unnamed protein product [Fraxinus pennsylvanica]
MNQTLLPNSSTLLHLLEIPRLMIFPTGMIRISTLRWMKEEVTPLMLRLLQPPLLFQIYSGNEDYSILPSWVYLIGRMCTIVSLKVLVTLLVWDSNFLPVNHSL